MNQIDVIALIAGCLGVETETISAESDSDTIAEWDSLAQVGLISELEAQLGDQLSPREISRLTSVSSVTRIIETRQAAIGEDAQG